MWILRSLVCLIRNHIFAYIVWQDSPYRYCLRCGKFEVQRAVTDLCDINNSVDLEEQRVLIGTAVERCPES